MGISAPVIIDAEGHPVHLQALGALLSAYSQPAHLRLSLRKLRLWRQGFKRGEERHEAEKIMAIASLHPSKRLLKSHACYIYRGGIVIINENLYNLGNAPREAPLAAAASYLSAANQGEAQQLSRR